MTSIKVAVQMDDPEILDKNADSTLAIIEEALKNFKVYTYTVDDLSLRDNKPIAMCREVRSLNIKKENFLQLYKAKEIFLSSFTAILVRQDPPYNMKYLTATYILEKIAQKNKDFK